MKKLDDAKFEKNMQTAAKMKLIKSIADLDTGAFDASANLGLGSIGQKNL